MEGNRRPQRPGARGRIDPADWFYSGVLEDALVLTIDRAYFSLTGGLERWLYGSSASTAAVRTTAGASTSPISTPSPAASRRSSIVYDIRDIVRRQPLPGYSLAIDRSPSGAERLSFKSSSVDPLAEAPRRGRVSQPAGDKL